MLSVFKKIYRRTKTFVACKYEKFLLNIDVEKSIKTKYKRIFGKEINLENPETFAEKIQWLKLNDRDSRIVEYADKFLVRDFVKKTIGEEYLIPMPFVWNTPEEIDFSLLPLKFVLKPNNSSGRVIICKDKNNLNTKKAIKTMKKWEKENLTKETGEWVYEHIPFKIVCEEFICDDIVDYKMYYADGNFIATQAIVGRGTENKFFAYFDKNWNLLPIARKGHKLPQNAPAKPVGYEKMIELADDLSKGFAFCRVDLYNCEGKIYFGEMSFYPNNGFVCYENDEMDKFFSEPIKLPSYKGESK